MSETELVERLERLERAHRRLKGFALAVLLLITALVTIHATQPVPEKITAHKFLALDDSGNVRVLIDATKRMPGIVLYDARDIAREAMVLDQSGSPSILLSDAAGKKYVSLEVTPEGKARISVLDTKGKAEIAIYREGAPFIALSDAQGERRAGMFVDPAGSPNISLTDANGFEMDLGSTGKINERTGATEQTSAASIVMARNDKEHHVIWQAP